MGRANRTRNQPRLSSQDRMTTILTSPVTNRPVRTLSRCPIDNFHFGFRTIETPKMAAKSKTRGDRRAAVRRPAPTIPRREAPSQLSKALVPSSACATRSHCPRFPFHETIVAVGTFLVNQGKSEARTRFLRTTGNGMTIIVPNSIDLPSHP